MNNRTDFLFTLMPQRDRRQLPDRRMAFRGSRRAVDLAMNRALPMPGASVLWTGPSNATDRGVDKQVLH